MWSPATHSPQRYNPHDTPHCMWSPTIHLHSVTIHDTPHCMWSPATHSPQRYNPHNTPHCMWSPAIHLHSVTIHMTHHTACGRLQYISTALQSTQHTTLHVVACNTSPQSYNPHNTPHCMWSLAIRLHRVTIHTTHHTACGRLQYVSTALQSTQHTTLHVVTCNTSPQRYNPHDTPHCMWSPAIHLHSITNHMTHHTACGRLQYISTAL